MKIDPVKLVMQFLNLGTLAGSLFLKAPQIIAIYRARSVSGIAESMVVTEAISILVRVFPLVYGFFYG